MIDGVISMMQADDDFIGPVNLGNPAELSILELARLITEMTESASKIVFKPLPQDDPLQRRPDISLARDRLGWEPSVAIEEGLRKTIDYFREVL
jgi:UDP-glucuronate decarboxylase